MTHTPRIGELVLPAAGTPRLRLSYTFHFCLYQSLLRMTREHSLGLSRPEAGWRSAVQRLSAVYLPLGPFNFLEYAIARARSAEYLSRELGTRAAEQATAIAEAVSEMEKLYERDLWPQHGAKLAAALDQLRRPLTAHKDDLLERLADRLWAREHPESYEVLLVADCHEATGAYSHPTVVSVETFAGMALVEAIVHELAHVLAQHTKEQEGSLWAELVRQCQERERPVRFTAQLFHLLLFHAGGEVVREVMDRDYVPYVVRNRLYEKFGTALGFPVDGERLEKLYTPRQQDVAAGIGMLLDGLLGR